jgi:hypothetical protein
LGAVQRFCCLGGKGADGVTAGPTGCDGWGTNVGAEAWRACDARERVSQGVVAQNNSVKACLTKANSKGLK